MYIKTPLMGYSNIFLFAQDNDILTMVLLLCFSQALLHSLSNAATHDSRSAEEDQSLNLSEAAEAPAAAAAILISHLQHSALVRET